ncbi:MBL fold metallo-hydrolase [Ramlibacter sp.]|uniref:MBL fold metallo-hydrolase n=1 Tax=Ramlibacter sp. TaxID=1917967 RepID=UPI0017CD36FB|nr:MBL fold metallo-hydrolase [Ramlibacter sp.]MBA2674359.1 MBL fold metallo-hydrolase [Ramlibacter sp.]
MAEAGLLPPGVMVFERGWLSANNILFVSPQHTALIDSGYCTHARQTVELVRGVLRERPLDLLLNTHLHSDHCGGNAILQERYPAVETRIPPGLAAVVRRWDPVALSYEPTGQQCPRFRIEGVLAPGSDIVLGQQTWQVHAAPGHDQHSLVLFEPGCGALISADALWENGFGVVFQELEGEDAFDQVAATLDLIESLQAKTVIPGHGGVFTDVRSALGAARRRLDGFSRDPRKHARHAAKVLLKFKLLEIQRAHMDELLAWTARTPYFALVHKRWFSDVPRGEWEQELVEALMRSGAAIRDSEWICNL